MTISEKIQYLFSKINWGASSLDGKAIEIMNNLTSDISKECKKEVDQNSSCACDVELALIELELGRLHSAKNILKSIIQEQAFNKLDSKMYSKEKSFESDFMCDCGKLISEAEFEALGMCDDCACLI